MSKIVKVLAREILDSRGFPTVQVDVYLKNGIIGRSSVPSGASTGVKEALELRDNDLSRFLGKGVMKSIFIINNIISKEIIGLDVLDHCNIDRIMIDLDGTPNKSKLGANSILAVSLSMVKASSKFLNLPLYYYIHKLNNIKHDKFCMPIPMINIINGGCHTNNNIDIQEFMIQPVGARSFRHAMRIGSEIFHVLGNLLKLRGDTTSVGDEGGYAPNLSSNEEAIILILDAIRKAGYTEGKDVFIAIDCAASEFYSKKDKVYFLKGENKKFNSCEFIDYLKNLVNTYPIISIEDALSDNDWGGFVNLTNILGKKIQIVGDDLFATNIMFLKKGIECKAANSILVKLNQIGTFTETLNTIKLAKENNYSTIISHRSGETEDTFIADLSVGVNSGQIKTGSLCRSERICKYNRLMFIEEELGVKSYYNKFCKI